MYTNMHCSFCNTKDDVSLLPSLEEAWICFSCVLSAMEVVQHEQKVLSKSFAPDDLTPMDIKAKLDEYVIGQDDAKKILAIAGYNHLKRIGNPSVTKTFKKSNVLLIGSTGIGKTYLVENLGKILGVPFISVDGSSFTSAGYVGQSAEDVLRDLLDKAEGSLHAAQQGIVYIDEVDKLAATPKDTEDSLGKGAQHNFLRLIEGAKVSVGRQQKHQKYDDFLFDTKNVLFICGGSFQGLDEIVLRHQSPTEIGFRSTITRASKDVAFSTKVSTVMPEHLTEFGLIPEFLGRVPVTAILQDLTVSDLERILVEPTDSLLSQYQNLFGLRGVTLEMEPEAVTAIAQIALDRKVGARGLRGITEEVLKDLMYEVPSDPDIRRVVITQESVHKIKDPIIFHKREFQVR